ncbi:MAG: LacI family DNA-binding transcriptional regulator [Bacteroidetes bacterium]|nr:LacI family DNA-binding transcriptional regulator [Bacteroidota bacterium]
MIPTVHDVARHAKVSISTVSRVINDSAPVSADKKERVVAAIKALKFTPNPAARRLLGQASRTIGVILPSITGEFFADLLYGLDAAAKQHDYLLMVSSSRRLEIDFIAAFESMNRRVDGMIIMVPELTAERVLSLVNPVFPFVFLNTKSEDEKINVVNFDNRGGMASIARHLSDLGHTRVAFINGPDDAFDAQQRRQGFLEAAPSELEVLEYPGDFTFECGYDSAQKILRLQPRPTAIVATNDLGALGALRALLENGISIPQEIAITGFDGTGSAHFATPSLTTVDVPIDMLASKAVEILISRIAGVPVDELHCPVMPLELIPRESSARKNVSSLLAGM